MMTISDLALIAAPVVTVHNDKETEYKNGSAAAEAYKAQRVNVDSMSVRDSKVVIVLKDWTWNPPSNFIGEAAVG